MSRTQRQRVVVLGAGLTLTFVMVFGAPAPPAARAEGPAAQPTAAQKAKQHYLQGEAYFKSRNFSGAMEEYQNGYLEKPDPIFIFNMAQCQRLLGNRGPALEFYRRYLREAPRGAGRPIAE